MSNTIVTEPSVDVITITPEMAVDMLKQNKRNRKVSQSTVAAYAREMSAGRWNFVGDPIRFNGDGSLLDGQHRLSAVIAAETPQKFVVVTGLPSDSQVSMDIGRRRSFADILAMRGQPYGQLIQGVATLLIRWDANQVVHLNLKPTPPELDDYFSDNPGIARSAEIASRVRSFVPVGPSPIGAVHYRASKVRVGAAAEFFAALADGSGLQKGNPILTLRNRLIRNKVNDDRLTTAEILYFTTRAWNAWRASEELVTLRLPTDGLTNATFPTPR